MEKDIKRRIKLCGVHDGTLRQGVLCGAYKNMKFALDRLDDKCPMDSSSRNSVVISRLALINQDIDRALFRLATMTSAWTWLEDYNAVFVLIGPEKRGTILHRRMRRSIPFRLRFHRRREYSFLRFKGDTKRERYTKKGARITSRFQMLAGRMRMSTRDARDIFEVLVRSCDDSTWIHTEFPFVWPSRKLSVPHRLLARYGLLIHQPLIDQLHPITQP